MTLAYARRGLIGLLAPQANTTVEPECAILCQPGCGLITSRLTSTRPTLPARLIDYLEAVDGTISRFANAPLDAIAFACTGSSYLVGPGSEARIVTAISAGRRVPFITATDAVHAALEVLDAERVGIVSPYEGALHEACLTYWRSRGLSVAAVAQVANYEPAFHRIYSLGPEAAADALGEIDPSAVDAAVILGTGLPSLYAIRRATGFGRPVLSCNLALMWRAFVAVIDEAPSAANLQPWMSAGRWGDRFDRHMAKPIT